MKIQFNKGATIGDLYGPAMKIKSKKEAQEYLEALVAHIMKDAKKKQYKTREGAEALAKRNLGYYAGYYDEKTAARVYKLFSTVHPIFGETLATPKEAMEAGKKLASKKRNKYGKREKNV